ncbi:MAG: transaldolase [Sulfurimonas sp.]|uniref:transaldolase n=1 Tax=Sulfurimonas sp. TaxID=2022749 RepID=UPI0025D42B9A|nr:transaldolase [Sulfurimonas sp.]MCK9491647.1 transaldolase [Sulfurimonas sp.]
MYIEELKFSLWADFIERDYLDGEFKKLVKHGTINGATSNPAIFKSAILTSSAYKEQLASLKGQDPKAKYEAVAIFDIQKAADILKPLYDKGDDGYVSIEVDPFFCDDADATTKEGKRLFCEIGRENVMIKVPATTAGYIAIEELVADGIPVNATLIFKKDQAISCAKAIERGLQRYKKSVNSVISIFVSRVDRAIDARLKEAGVEVALSGIYNSADIYSVIQEMNVEGCRALFASTGVKDDTLEASYYVDKLLGYNCVNTAPIETIKAFDETEIKEQTLPIDPNIIKEHFKRVKDAGIDLDEVLDGQIEDGLVSFKEAFKDILESL